jgi:integrase
MSIRKRTWQTAKGEAREAWIVDYVDQAGKRRLKTVATKKEATAFAATATVEIRQVIHTPDSSSKTVAEAAASWLESCRPRGLERSTVDSYEQHVTLHIVPYLGRFKLSQVSAPGVREFEDRLRHGGRSPAMVRKILTSLSSLLSDAQKRGLVSRNVVRELGSRRKKGVDRRADRRQKGRVKVGVDVTTPEGNAKYPGLHALRHFYASWCINRREDGGLGLTPKLVQERLGHSNIAMTLDVCGHLFPRGDDGSEMAEAERSLLG